MFSSFKNDSLFKILFPLTTESAQQSSSIFRIVRAKVILRNKRVCSAGLVTHPYHVHTNALGSVRVSVSLLDRNANHHKIFR